MNVATYVQALNNIMFSPRNTIHQQPSFAIRTLLFSAMRWSVNTDFAFMSKN